MLLDQVPPVDDPFVMKDTVTQFANRVEIGLDPLSVAKRPWHVGECHSDPLGKEASPGFLEMDLEHRCPESELEFGNDAPGSHRATGPLDADPGISDLLMTKRCQDNCLVPSLGPRFGGHCPVNGISKTNFKKMNGGIQ